MTAIVMASTSNLGEIGWALLCARLVMMRSFAFMQRTAVPGSVGLHAAALRPVHFPAADRLARLFADAPPATIVSLHPLHR